MLLAAIFCLPFVIIFWYTYNYYYLGSRNICRDLLYFTLAGSVAGARMPDPAEPAVLHARVSDGEGGVGGPRLPGVHPPGALRVHAITLGQVIAFPRVQMSKNNHVRK